MFFRQIDCSNTTTYFAIFSLFLLEINFRSCLRGTVGVKSQNVNPILHCKTPIWRVGVWPKWVGPAHSTLGQLTQYTSRLRYSKMSDFHQVVLKWHTFVFLSGQLWLILVLAWWWVKCKCVPFQNYWAKKAHILVF